MSKQLIESVAANATRKGNRWLVTVARPGKGSSGTYTAEMLKQWGPVAFPPGTRSYMNHARPEERDVKDLAGVFPDGVYWDSVAQELRGELQTVNPLWEEVISRASEHKAIDISMFSLDFEKDENDLITRIGHTRANSIDLVGTGGLEGAGFKELVESARGFIAETSTDSVEENRKNMELEEVKGAVANLTAIVESLVSELSEKKISEAQVKADEDAANAAVAEALANYKASEALIEAARNDLTVSQIESLRASATEAKDLPELIESYKKITLEAREGFILAESAKDVKLPMLEGKTSTVDGSAYVKEVFGE